MEYCKSNWPQKHLIHPETIPYWKFRSSFSIHENLLLFNDIIVVPTSLRREMLQHIHEGHQGIERCRVRARASVWWPNISKEIMISVQKCQECVKASIERKEPLIISPLPDWPWKTIGTDLFELDKKRYILVVDYFSRYPEVIRLHHQL